MIAPVDTVSDLQAAHVEGPVERTLGPLFKELYTGLIDVEDPSVSRLARRNFSIC